MTATSPPALEDLLEAAIRRGSSFLRILTRDALERHLATGRVVGSLFTPQELAQLAGRFAVVNAAAELLGRLRLRRQHARELRRVQVFNEQKEFDWDAWLREAVTPHAAIEWFRDLMPVKADPYFFDLQHRGRAFQLAATTDQTILRKVHEVIADRLETGKQIGAAPRVINEILNDAGVSRGAPYAEMVFRTNVMESYRNGSWSEMRDPDVAPYFPVWQYLGIADGRERKGPWPDHPDHHRHFGKYWPTSITFQDVRGRLPKDVCNCRCSFRAISAVKWRRLLAQGAVLQTGI